MLNFAARIEKYPLGFIWPVLKIVKIPLYASHFVSKTLLGRLEERVYTSKIHITWKSAHISALSTSLPFHVGQKNHKPRLFVKVSIGKLIAGCLLLGLKR